MAGKLNDPGKKRDIVGNFAKFIIVGKEKLRSPFLPFLFKNKITRFFKKNSTVYKIYLLNCIFCGGEKANPTKKEVLFTFEFASKILGIFGKRDPEKPVISPEFENGK